MLGFEYLDGSNADPSGPPWVEPPGEHHHSADTWYPTAGRNGKIYTPWTDGKVHGLYSNSGGTLGIATTGMAVVELPPDFVPARDVFKLKVLSTYNASQLCVLLRAAGIPRECCCAGAECVEVQY